MRFPATYRQKEVKIISHWITSGVSGCVVGLSESGRTNLLGFLCNRLDVLERCLTDQTKRIMLIPVDIYNLPNNDLSSLYRTILHAFYWRRDEFGEEGLQQAAYDLYIENRAATDPFLPQMALYDLLRLFEEAEIQVVLVLNRFDRFCETATPQMLNTLRGLRDTFRGTLSYIVGMLQEARYLSEPTDLGDMYDILDRHVCWIGAMSDVDADEMLTRDVLPKSMTLNHKERESILRLSGNFPGLIKTVGLWWLRRRPGITSPQNLTERLLSENSIQYRVERLWDSLTQEEQLTLSEVQKLESKLPFLPQAQDAIGGLSKQTITLIEGLVKQHKHSLWQLADKGLCVQINYQDGPAWVINGALLSAYVANAQGRARGRVWLDESASQIYQGRNPIEELTALEHGILSFLIGNPRMRHTNDDIIDHAWPDEERREGITTNALQVHISSIRKKIEPNPARPHYLLTWRGNPGGYQFFPEGKPG
ncbi:helix-turn-helix domain-containing protein [Chloroflexi bacterium TSY]|nr:helix-turn-helix domain-containing protein [Chloroflexi bacterium TSY]